MINRKDYGVTWNAALETGGVLVSDKITLEFEVSAIKSRLTHPPRTSRPRPAPPVTGGRGGAEGRPG